MPINDTLFERLRAVDVSILDLIWTDLKCATTKKDFSACDAEQKIFLISIELRSVAGHSVANLFRGDHDLPYEQILVDVADKLKPDAFGWTSHNIHDDPKDIERTILGFLDERAKLAWANLSNEKREAIDEKLRKDAGHLKSLTGRRSTLNVVGFSSGLWLLGTASLMGGMVIAAPVVTLGALSAVAGTSYSKTVPAIVRLLAAIEMERQFEETGESPTDEEPGQ